MGGQVEGEYAGSDFVGTAKLVNMNPLKETGIWCVPRLPTSLATRRFKLRVLEPRT